MNSLVIIALAIATLDSPGDADPKDLDPHDPWPQRRGPLGAGVTPHGNPPVEWSENKNVLWKFAIPAGSHIVIASQ